MTTINLTKLEDTVALTALTAVGTFVGSLELGGTTWSWGRVGAAATAAGLALAYRLVVIAKGYLTSSQ